MAALSALLGSGHTIDQPGGLQGVESAVNRRRVKPRKSPDSLAIDLGRRRMPPEMRHRLEDDRTLWGDPNAAQAHFLTQPFAAGHAAPSCKNMQLHYTAGSAHQLSPSPDPPVGRGGAGVRPGTLYNLPT